MSQRAEHFKHWLKSSEHRRERNFKNEIQINSVYHHPGFSLKWMASCSFHLLCVWKPGPGSHTGHTCPVHSAGHCGWCYPPLPRSWELCLNPFLYTQPETKLCHTAVWVIFWENRSFSDRWYNLRDDCWLPTLYPKMSPLRSVSGTSPHRTRMLLEVVAKADTLVGPLEGTAVRGCGLACFKHIYMITYVFVMCMGVFPFSPDSLVLPWTGWLQGPEPIPLIAWTLTSYSVHSSRSSIVNSLSSRSMMTWERTPPLDPAFEYCTR